MVAGGLLIILYGLEKIDQGVLAYRSAAYRITVYSAGAIAAGILGLLLATIPDRLLAYLQSAEASVNRRRACWPRYPDRDRP